jgi:hypothetical protein
MRSFGSFNPNNDKIWVYVKNRNMADILRTLAHELVHRKQAEDGRIENKSGNTGSDIENEANAMAGILLRKFGKQNENIYESKKKFGNYLFGDKETGVKIGWYDSEKEEDTPAEKELFNYLKKYADSEAETYSNISLDHLIPVFKKIKSQYPEIGEPKASGYIYRGTSVSNDKLEQLTNEPNVEEIGQNIIIPNQEYSSRRKVSSWSTNYYNAATFAQSTAERKGGIPVVMRAKANDAELFFNPRFMNKLSTQLEEETFNITRPLPVDIMIIKEYKDEFEDIEADYLHNKTLSEAAYPFSEHDSTYDEEDNSLITVEYTFKTKKNKYKVNISSIEKAREFEVLFGIDTGELNKVDTFQMTGEGDAKNILETVAEIINNFYYQYKEEVDKIIIAGTDEKRSRVYKAFLPKYLNPEVKEKTEIK